MLYQYFFKFYTDDQNELENFSFLSQLNNIHVSHHTNTFMMQIIEYNFIEKYALILLLYFNFKLIINIS